MAEKMVYDKEAGVCRRVIRDDAVRLRDPDRLYVPTTEHTKWVGNWAEFKAVGGHVSFTEDQTNIELLLPEPYKFSISFFDQGGE